MKVLYEIPPSDRGRGVWEMSMDEATLEALKGSIAKWERLAAGEAGEIPCPLCSLFNSSTECLDNDCMGCPVFAVTQRRYCKATPYVEAMDAEENFGRDSQEYLDAAEAELDFLKSLLP